MSTDEIPLCDHPSRTRYNDGCKCEGCAAANRAYIAEWRQRNRWKDAEYRRRARARRRAARDAGGGAAA